MRMPHYVSFRMGRPNVSWVKHLVLWEAFPSRFSFWQVLTCAIRPEHYGQRGTANGRICIAVMVGGGRWLRICAALWRQTVVNVKCHRCMTGLGPLTVKMLSPNQLPFPFGLVLGFSSHSCRPDISSCAIGRLELVCLSTEVADFFILQCSFTRWHTGAERVCQAPQCCSQAKSDVEHCQDHGLHRS